MDILLLVYQVPYYTDPLVMSSVIGATSLATFAVTRVYDALSTVNKKEKKD